MTEPNDAGGARQDVPPADQAWLPRAAQKCCLGLWEWQIAGQVCRVNEAACELLGLPPGTVVFTPDRFVRLVHGDDLVALKEALEAAPHADEAVTLEFRIHREDTNELRWLAAKACLIEGSGSDAPAIAGICHDITTRRHEQEARELFHQEIGHRMKNLLSIVSSLASLSGEYRPEARDFIVAFQARLNGLAATHALLIQSGWSPISLAQLSDKVLSPLGVVERVDISGDTSFELGAHDAHTLGLVLNELATNAIKYGALSNNEGRVQLSFQRAESVKPGDASSLVLRWQEFGGPPVLAPEAKGFGVTLLERLTRRHAQAEPLLQWSPGGLRCCVTLPLTSASR